GPGPRSGAAAHAAREGAQELLRGRLGALRGGRGAAALSTSSRRAPLLLLPALVACAFSPDPDKRNRELPEVAPLVSAGAIEVLAELPRPPGNLAVLPDGRVVFSWHPEAQPEEHLALLLPGGG